MLSVYTRAQIAIAVLHDLSSSKVLQPVKFLLQNEEWKDLLNKLETIVVQNGIKKCAGRIGLPFMTE